MKAKLTVTIEEELIPRAKEIARLKGVSLSQLIENALRAIDQQKQSSFSHRWRGRFTASQHKDDRYRQLKEKYL